MVKQCKKKLKSLILIDEGSSSRENGEYQIKQDRLINMHDIGIN